MTIRFSAETEDAMRDVRDVYNAYRKDNNQDLALLFTIATMIRLADPKVPVRAAPGEDVSPMRTRG